MSHDNRVILLEFNELSPTIMHRFLRLGSLPNFQRFFDQAEIYTTDAREQSPNLNPWIQWVTVHSGLDYREHRIFHLGDGIQLNRKCIWDLLSDAGLTVGICGSMNIRYDTPLNGYVLPDPWSAKVPPQPEELLLYFRFIQLNVQEHTNTRVPLTKSDYLRFIGFMLSHGLSLSTAWSIIRQILSERLGRDRWKRAVIMDELQFDVFKHYFEGIRPHFSTFFLNSTAHFQHMYWRNMEPELFEVKPTDAEQGDYENAILFGYQSMDNLLGKFLDLAGKDTTLIFCTALSQQPCLMYEGSGGKSFYRPNDFKELLRFAGVTSSCEILPVMSEQFHIVFPSVEAANQAEEHLNALHIKSTPVFSVERKGSTIFTGCTIFSDVAEDAVVVSCRTERLCPFYDLFYRVDAKKSGMHHPDGMLWIRHPSLNQKIHETRVPLTRIAPTILNMFSVTPPQYMRGEPLQEAIPLPQVAVGAEA